ncbi:UNVERIFIED_CONTAM: hypothetical protein FKN15_035062 [Acipenser sinensis]
MVYLESGTATKENRDRRLKIAWGGGGGYKEKVVFPADPEQMVEGEMNGHDLKASNILF